MSLRFWQQGSRPSHQAAPPLALGILVSVTSDWTRPPLQAPSHRAPLLHLRVVEEVGEHLSAPDLGLLSHKTRATPAAGKLATTLALWAAATLPRTCYLPPPRLLQSHLLSEDTKCLATRRMHRNRQCISEVALCTPRPHHTVPTSRRATPHTPMSEGLGHTWRTTPQCLRHLLPPNMIRPQCQTGTVTVTETQGGATGQRGLAPEGHLTTSSKTQTLPQSTIPITPITTQNAGTKGGTGETAWAPDQVTTATRDTATTTILTTTTAAAAAGGAAMTGTEIETETETETVTSPTALTPDTIPTPTAPPLTACLLPPHLTPLTPPKSRPQPLLRD